MAWQERNESSWSPEKKAGSVAIGVGMATIGASFQIENPELYMGCLLLSTALLGTGLLLIGEDAKYLPSKEVIMYTNKIQRYVEERSASFSNPLQSVDKSLDRQISTLQGKANYLADSRFLTHSIPDEIEMLRSGKERLRDFESHLKRIQEKLYEFPKTTSMDYLDQQPPYSIMSGYKDTVIGVLNPLVKDPRIMGLTVDTIDPGSQPTVPIPTRSGLTMIIGSHPDNPDLYALGIKVPSRQTFRHIVHNSPLREGIGPLGRTR